MLKVSSEQRTFETLIFKLEPKLKKLKQSDRKVFIKRLEAHFSNIISHFHHLYNDQYDSSFLMEDLVADMIFMFSERSEWLKKQDEHRYNQPEWFVSENMVGAVCYVNLFAGDFQGLREKIPYLKKLNITYLHLMPLFLSPEQENDGGYAVSSYRETDSKLGTMDDLRELIRVLKSEGINVVLDFINNHTSDEHLWAQKAKEGDPFYQQFYYMFDDRTVPDKLEPHLREIFPEIRNGNFTFLDEMDKWVWTSFHSYQWDLNYRNPHVFLAMAKEMLFLANQGVDVLRLDAVPFTWKKMGTNCENLPEAHSIIKVLNAIVRVVAPSLIFKSEAIVHPDDVQEYISPKECQISYNPTVMALLWESLATRNSSLLKTSLQKRFTIPAGTTWVNYVRSHDDIGWTFSNEDAGQVGINGDDHRHFLNEFYTGNFAGSFASGLPFQRNFATGDTRICGTTASLAGLEKALSAGDEARIEDALKRIILLYGLTMSLGGIPLIYLGDETGMLNDYSYKDDPEKGMDSRWVHRLRSDEKRMERAISGEGLEGQLFSDLCQLIEKRKQIEPFGESMIHLLDTNKASLLAFLKKGNVKTWLIIANFSEQNFKLRESKVLIDDFISGNETDFELKDVISGDFFSIKETIPMDGYQLRWLEINF